MGKVVSILTELKLAGLGDDFIVVCIDSYEMIKAGFGESIIFRRIWRITSKWLVNCSQIIDCMHIVPTESTHMIIASSSVALGLTVLKRSGLFLHISQ